jgi:hypothetical protein
MLRINNDRSRKKKSAAAHVTVLKSTPATSRVNLEQKSNVSQKVSLFPPSEDVVMSNHCCFIHVGLHLQIHRCPLSRTTTDLRRMAGGDKCKPVSAPPTSLHPESSVRGQCWGHNTTLGSLLVDYILVWSDRRIAVLAPTTWTNSSRLFFFINVQTFITYIKWR